MPSVSSLFQILSSVFLSPISDNLPACNSSSSARISQQISRELDLSGMRAVRGTFARGGYSSIKFRFVCVNSRNVNNGFNEKGLSSEVLVEFFF